MSVEYFYIIGERNRRHINLEPPPSPIRTPYVSTATTSNIVRKTQRRPSICTRPRRTFLLSGHYHYTGITMGYRDCLTLVTSALYATHSYYNIRKATHLPSVSEKRHIALLSFRPFIFQFSWRKAENNGALHHRPTNRMRQTNRNTKLISDIPKTTRRLSDIAIFLPKVAKQMKNHSSSSADRHLTTRH